MKCNSIIPSTDVLETSNISPKRNLENLRNYGYRTEGTYLLNECTIGTILFHKNRLLALEAILE